MIRFLAALLFTLAPFTAQAAETIHYDVRATIGADGMLDADVRITLPEAAAGTGKAFLLGRRFVLVSGGFGRNVRVETVAAETPVKALNRITLSYPAGKRTLRFRYRGPLTPAEADGVPPIRPEGVELFIDHMWLPFGADIQTMFDVDARIDGLAGDLVVVAQGEVRRTPTGVVIHRPQLDVDLPLVAMRGLHKAAGPGVEYYATDLTTPVSQLYQRHALAASAYLAKWFDPLPDPIRMVAVSRERRLGYSRTAYTVVNDSGRPEGPLVEAGTARHVAHEFAHAWWRSASPLTDDFWLVESTAEYVAIRYIDAMMGPDMAKQLLDAKRAEAAKAGPVMGHGRPNRVQLYQKGPLLLVDLEQRIGRDKMDALLLEVSRTTPNTTGQFLELLTRIAGKDAAHDFDTALHAG
ncbi:hypothetical protein [Sphingomonas sp. ERG5]|uniref:hypothetical protein n=1 Tax=Sphingomonas sp. ERG5 TaxID=1381597 RepID=UPI00054B91A1|nr:hypothetical protein [Sphingomonas sp. ERG5]